jgi:hypothetical protein
MGGLDRFGHGRFSEGWGGWHREGSGKRKERAAIHFAGFEVRGWRHGDPFAALM